MRISLHTGLFLTLFCALSGQAHADSIYKWADGDGVVHFGSAPPSGNNNNAQRFDVNPRLMQSPLSNPQAELQKRVQQYNRYIELLRNMRAAELGISREELDTLEAAGLLP